MKHLKTIFLTILSVAILISCNNEDPNIANRILTAESLLETRPDSTLLILEQLDSSKIVTDDFRAKYALTKSIALDKLNIEKKDFPILQPAIDYYLKNGSDVEKLKTLLAQSVIFINQGNDDAAADCLVKAKNLTDDIPDSLVYARVLGTEGLLYYKAYQFKGYADNNIAAAEIFGKLNRVDDELYSYERALSGSMQIPDQEQANSILREIKKIAEKHPEKESSYYSDVLLNDASFGNHESIASTINILKNYSDLDTDQILNLANGYNEIGYHHDALSLLNDNPVDKDSPGYTKYLVLKYDAYKGLKQYDKAIECFEVYEAASEEEFEYILEHDMTSVQEKYDLEKAAMMERQEKDRVFWISVSSSLLLLLIILLIYNRYRISSSKRIVAERNAEIAQRDRDIAEQGKAIAEQERAIAEQGKNIAEKERAIAEKDRKIAERNTEIAQRDKEIALKDRELAIKERELAENRRITAETEMENLQLTVERLEEEKENLNNLIKGNTEMPQEIRGTIMERLNMLNGILAADITNNPRYSRQFREWKKKISEDRKAFIAYNRKSVAATYPNFMRYLENHGLTDFEIEYVCLYALGLQGKEVGEYIQLKRHYQISGAIRKKLGIDEKASTLAVLIQNLMQGRRP